MLGLILVLSVLFTFGLFCLAGWIGEREHCIEKGWSVDKSIFSATVIAGLMCVLIAWGVSKLDQ